MFVFVFLRYLSAEECDCIKGNFNHHNYQQFILKSTSFLVQVLFLIFHWTHHQIEIWEYSFVFL